MGAFQQFLGIKIRTGKDQHISTDRFHQIDSKITGGTDDTKVVIFDQVTFRIINQDIKWENIENTVRGDENRFGIGNVIHQRAPKRFPKLIGHTLDVLVLCAFILDDFTKLRDDYLDVFQFSIIEYKPLPLITDKGQYFKNVFLIPVRKEIDQRAISQGVKHLFRFGLGQGLTVNLA